MEELTDKHRAAVYREIAQEFDDTGSPRAAEHWRSQADELNPPAPVTIDKVDGWEVVWCSKGAIAVPPSDGNRPRRQWVYPDAVWAGSTPHPWPERPASADGIPEGWQLMRSSELEVDKHEVYDPDSNFDPWFADVLVDISEVGEHLVVARERADQ